MIADNAPEARALVGSPLILVTNDDGIASPGLRAAVEAVLGLGEIWVVAPRRQQSAMARSLPDDDGIIHRESLSLGADLNAYSVDTSPAGAVLYAMATLLPRPPDLAISGINYGENLGSGVTTSGTVGAAMEAASWGIPALAISLETEPQYHYSHSADIDFRVAGRFTRHLAQPLLAHRLPEGADLLKVDVPSDATPATPWRLTRVSRHRFFFPVPVRHPDGSLSGPLGYEARTDCDQLEMDSDIYAVVCRREVSVSPMTIDLTAHGHEERIREILGRALQGP